MIKDPSIKEEEDKYTEEEETNGDEDADKEVVEEYE